MVQPSRTLLLTLAVLLLVGSAAPAAAQGRGRAAQLEELLPRLAERAALYEETALRFSCEEEVTETEYDKNENIKKQAREVHDYLLEYTKRGGLQPYRAILSREDKPVSRQKVERNYGTPDPYAWQLMFVQEGQGRFQFRLLDQELLNPHDTWVIEFIALASYREGRTIAEWEGKVWVDQETLDVLQVEARPSKEADTLKAQLDEYAQSFSLLGLKTKKRPRARFLKVQFDVDRSDMGLRLPSRSLYSEKLVTDLEVMHLDSSVVQRFSRYVFFGVDALDKFKALKR